MRFVLLILCIFALAACAPISQQAKDDLAKPVDCDTAAADIAALESEKASVAEQTAAGVRSVVPASAVAGLLMGTTRDKAKVATGGYNKELEAKIAEIKTKCGL